MKNLIFGVLFLVSIGAKAGPAVTGGGEGICDEEKEPLFSYFTQSTQELKALVNKLDQEGFQKLCAVSSTSLVKPNLNGIEVNYFVVQFSNQTTIYNISIAYQAQRAKMPVGYKWHVPGAQDGTELLNPKLIDLKVTQENAPSGISIGF